MKIAQVVATFPPYMAGTGNVAYYYAVELAKLGHDVTVLTSRYPDEDYVYPEMIKVKRFKPLFRVGNAPLIPQLLREIKDFDIVHLHLPFFFGGEITYLVSKLKDQKYVVTYHNDVILGGVVDPLLNVYDRIILKAIIKNAKKVCVPSLDYAKHSKIREFVEKRKENIVEVPNGVDIKRFNPHLDPKEIRIRHGLENAEIVLFVGALDRAHYFKGVEYLLRSFARLRRNESRLVLVGDGDLKEYYINLSRKLGISDRTLFVGKVPDKDLPKYYVASDVVVLPSVTMGEAFGIVLIEAMACGKPVIATNLPGVRTVVDNGVTGFLVEPKNVDELSSKIEYLLENKDIRDKFGRAGRKKVEERYSWEKIASKLVNIYGEVVY